MDAVTLELVWTRLISAADEAAKAIVRTSFSTLSNEANDFACVLTDAAGHSLAQNTGSIPSFIGTLPATVRAVMAAHPPANMQPGDVFITNNPWIGTGHLNDISLVRPVFHGGRIVAYAATTSHVPDIGGRIRSTEAASLFEEGFHMPPLRFIRDGTPDATLLQLLRANVRTPDQTEGDVWAQVAAVALMENRVARCLADHALDDLTHVAEEIFARSEAELRKRLAALPDGVWEYGFITDGYAEPLHFHCRVTLKGGEVEVDFAGTSPQQTRAVNCVYGYTFAMAAFAIKALVLPELPNNEGIFRPIRVLAEEGSILNPRFPAPVGGRAATGHYVPPLIFGALASILPGRVRAAPGSPLWIVNLAGVDDAGRGFANVLFFNGGTGAGAAQDGVDCISFPSNISATPVEVAERTAPVFIHGKSLREGSGGTGRHAGGRGQEVLLEVLADGVQAVFVTERLKQPAPGLFGGGAGATGAVLLNGAEFDTRRQQRLNRGDVLTIRTPGGGGYG